MNDKHKGFAFRRYFDSLLNEVPLGRFDFQSLPVIYPEAHQNSETPELDKLHILATAEHEQIHDMLARQTTHGYIVLMGIRFFKKLPKDRQNKDLYRLIVNLHNEARAIHEAYATFGTLCVNRSFLPLIPTLTPEYLAYMNQAQALLPKKFVGLRIGRLFVYASILAALSPQISEPDSRADTREMLKKAILEINGCQQSWEKIQAWKQDNEEEIEIWLEQMAQTIGYTTIEYQLPIYFEDIVQFLSAEEEVGFEQKEIKFILNIVHFIGQKALPPHKQPLTVVELKPIIRLYRDLLVPNYRLEPILTDVLGLDETTFGLLDRLFQENIHSIILPNAVPTIHRLAVNIAALNRMAAHVHEHLFPLSIVGYLTDSLADSSFEKFKGHLLIQDKQHIQWNFLFHDLQIYNRGEKMEVLFSFEKENFDDINPEVGKNLSLLLSPADYYQKSSFKQVADRLAKQQVSIYLFQPINFLNFLEWRVEKNLPIHNFLVEIVALPNENFSLMKIWFEDIPYAFIRLVAQTSIIGMLRLYTLEKLKMSLQMSDFPTEKDMQIVNFLRVFWK